MQLSAPTKLFFYVSLAIAALAVVANFVPQMNFSGMGPFGLAIIAYIVLLLGNVMKGV